MKRMNDRWTRSAGLALLMGLGWAVAGPARAQDAAGDAPRTGLIADLPMDVRMFPTAKEYAVTYGLTSGRRERVATRRIEKATRA